MKNYAEQVASTDHGNPVRNRAAGSLSPLAKLGAFLFCAISVLAADPDSAADKFVKELLVVWTKAKAGDNSAKQTFGEAFWNTATNQTGSRFIDLALPTVREQMLSDDSKWLTAGQKIQMRELLRKGDAGDKVARGDAALMAIGDMFQMIQRKANEPQTAIEKSRPAVQMQRSSTNGTASLVFGPMRAGTNGDVKAGDVLEARLSRTASDKFVLYSMVLTIRGQSAFGMENRNAVRFQINDSSFVVTNQSQRGASTNALGKTLEMAFFRVPEELAHLFATAKKGAATLEGTHRRASINFSEDFIAALQEFGKECKREDDMQSHPVSPK